MSTFDSTLYIFETSFTTTQDFADPIRAVNLTVTFTGPDNAEQTVDGFWDGNDTWRVRFLPPVAGEWHYTTTCVPTVDGLHGESGTFTASSYTGGLPLLQHGPIRASAEGHSLIHADGTPFFWLADTAWNGVLKAKPDDWNRYLAIRKGQGFTAIQAVITQWRSFPADEAGDMAFTGTEAITIHPAFYQRIDAKLAAIAAHGLVPAPVLIWACTPKDPGYYLPAEDCILLARYEVARYGAYRPVWLLGGDGEYRGDAAEKWKQTGRAVFGDSGHHAVTMHPRGVNWPGEDLRGEPWLTFHSYQSGHGDSDAHLRWLQMGPPAANWAIAPIKPIINQEPNYEHHRSYKYRQVFNDYHVRRANYWSLLVSPTAGVTYGHHGIWPWMEEPGVPMDHHRTGEAPPWHVAVQAKGAEQLRHLRTFFDQLDWWKLRPAQHLLTRQPGLDDPNRFIAAAQVEENGPVVIYTPHGDPICLTISLAKARWFDPRNGQWQPAEGQAEFSPPDGEDWVLVGER